MSSDYRKCSADIQKYLDQHTFKTYVCDSCGKVFTQKLAKENHVLTHSAEKRFVVNIYSMKDYISGLCISQLLMAVSVSFSPIGLQLVAFDFSDNILSESVRISFFVS